MGLLHCVTANVPHTNVAVEEFFAHAFEAILQLTSGAFDFLIAFGTKAFAPSAKTYIFLLLELVLDIFILSGKLIKSLLILLLHSGKHDLEMVHTGVLLELRL